jgi:DNA-directed RNA polymerase I, II, and III subunit RPABC2
MSDNEYEESVSGSESDNDSEIGEIKTSKKIPVNGDISDDAADSDIDMDENDDISDADSVNMDDEINDMTNTTSSSQKNKNKDLQNTGMGVLDNDYDVNGDDEDDDDDDDDVNDPDYFKKFDENIKHDIISSYHHEMIQHNYQEVEILSNVVRNEKGTIIDPFHKTLSFLTKYEKARILGERARQINAGATPFIQVDNFMIDGYLIALKELEEKKIPFIIKRPLPNGGCEYWKLKDLEFIH